MNRSYRAEDEPEYTGNGYWMLEIKRLGPDHYRYGTNEGEYLAAHASEPNFRDAWTQALSQTTMGWDSLTKAREWEPQPIDPGTEPDSPVYSGEGFDPYAGQLDQLLGY
jgi:hypothetical protein